MLKYRRGITLVELAIVIMIMGMIFSGLFASYTMALRITRTSLSKKGTETNEVLKIIDNLRSSLSMAYFNTYEARLIFISKSEGEKFSRKDRVDFIAILPNSVQSNANEVREVGFYLKKMDLEEIREQYYYLVRRESPFVDEKPREGGIEYILLEYVRSLQFKYSRDGRKWQDDWDAKLNGGLPRFIRIEIIALTESKHQRYETLVFPHLLFK